MALVLIVEDGSIVSGANTYVSAAELEEYAENRGVTLTGEPDELLIQAMDYLETLSYVGKKKTKEQPLQWPRLYVYIDGYCFPSDEIPQELKTAQMSVALAIDAGNSPLNTIERATKREKVDVLEVEYMDNASITVIVPAISASLRKLLASGFGGNICKVTRA